MLMKEISFEPFFAIFKINYNLNIQQKLIAIINNTIKILLLRFMINNTIINY